MVFTTAQKVTKHLGFIVIKFLVKKFQKLSNLVTLKANYQVSFQLMSAPFFITSKMLSRRRWQRLLKIWIFELKEDSKLKRNKWSGMIVGRLRHCTASADILLTIWVIIARLNIWGEGESNLVYIIVSICKAFLDACGRRSSFWPVVNVTNWADLGVPKPKRVFLSFDLHKIAAKNVIISTKIYFFNKNILLFFKKNSSYVYSLTKIYLRTVILKNRMLF